MVASALKKLGGIASASELYARRIDPEWIRISVNYRKIIKIRKGWYALRGTSAEAIEARQVGGRLACLSARAYHGVDGIGDGQLHVAVARGSSRLRRGDNVVVHWVARDAGSDRLAIDITAAWKQADRCAEARAREALATARARSSGSGRDDTL